MALTICMLTDSLYPCGKYIQCHAARLHTVNSHKCYLVNCVFFWPCCHIQGLYDIKLLVYVCHCGTEICTTNVCWKIHDILGANMFSVMLPERTQYIALTPWRTEYKVLFPCNMGLDMLGELDRVCEVIVNSYRSYFLLFCFLSSFWFIVSECFPVPAGFYSSCFGWGPILKNDRRPEAR